MRAATLLLLLIAIIICLLLENVFLAVLLSAALVAIAVFFLLSKTASAAKKAGKSLSKGTVEDMEKAKGQSPKATAELGKIFESLGAKTGEAAWTKEKESYRSEDLLGRLGTASKNLLDGLGRLFK